MSGFTKSYRSKWQHPIFRDLLEAAMWSWMCDTAAWRDTAIRFNGELVKLERGQLVTSIRFMSQGFRVGEQVTRTFLQNLENEGMTNTLPTRRGTIITICNYDKYQQNEKSDNTLDNNQPTHCQHTANTNKKEDKELKEEKEEVLCRMPFKDFPIDWREWTLSKTSLVGERMTDEWGAFKEYWTIGKGKNTKRADWFRTWRKWCEKYLKVNSNSKTDSIYSGVLCD